MELPKWHERPESSKEKVKDQKVLDGKNFLKLADHFISFANTKNKTIKSTELNYMMLYAAAVNPGASGAPLLNKEGHLIGMVDAIYTKQADIDAGVNFAIDIKLIEKFLNKYASQIK